jgi:hypothetical protein
MPMTEYPFPGWVLRLAAASLALTVGAAVAFGQTTLVANSPFAPAGTAAAAGAAPAEAYELAGSSVQGSTVLVCIFDRQAKHSEWIPVGGASGTIQVISYDRLHDKAVVTISGTRKELGLRSAAVAKIAASETPAPVAPASVPAPNPAPAAPLTPETKATLAHDQNEARMLVSDLLEIGVQQRKAYQEAKQKAATETPAQPTN